MKRKILFHKKYFIFLLLLFISVSSFIIINNNFELEKSEYRNEIKQGILRNESMKTSFDNLVNSFSTLIKSENRQINGNNFFIDSLTKKVLSPKLVLRFSELSCHSCLEEALYELEKINEYINDSDILIISSFSDNKKYNIFKNQFKHNYIFMNEKKHENIINPQFFILDKDLKTTYLYIYQDGNFDLNKSYFESIKFFFTKKK